MPCGTEADMAHFRTFLDGEVGSDTGQGSRGTVQTLPYPHSASFGLGSAP